MKLRTLILYFFSVLLPLSLLGGDQNLFALLKEPNHFAMIRHALAPGTGDPSNFDLKDCSTQRNLSESGRKQAIAIGELFRSNGIKEAMVVTSEWCRCRETAKLLDLGEVKELPALNSFFGRPDDREPNLKALRAWLENRDGNQPTLLITHQVVITAMTGVFPTSGEIIIVKRDEEGDFKVKGRVKTR